MRSLPLWAQLEEKSGINGQETRELGNLLLNWRFASTSWNDLWRDSGWKWVLNSLFFLSCKENGCLLAFYQVMKPFHSSIGFIFVRNCVVDEALSCRFLCGTDQKQDFQSDVVFPAHAFQHWRRNLTLLKTEMLSFLPSKGCTLTWDK